MDDATKAEILEVGPTYSTVYMVVDKGRALTVVSSLPEAHEFMTAARPKHGRGLTIKVVHLEHRDSHQVL
jgi:hypothetical protein